MYPGRKWGDRAAGLRLIEPDWDLGIRPELEQKVGDGKWHARRGPDGAPSSHHL